MVSNSKIVTTKVPTPNKTPTPDTNKNEPNVMPDFLKSLNIGQNKKNEISNEIRKYILKRSLSNTLEYMNNVRDTVYSIHVGLQSAEKQHIRDQQVI